LVSLRRAGERLRPQGQCTSPTRKGQGTRAQAALHTMPSGSVSAPPSTVGLPLGLLQHASRGGRQGRSRRPAAQSLDHAASIATPGRAPPSPPQRGARRRQWGLRRDRLVARLCARAPGDGQVLGTGAIAMTGALLADRHLRCRDVCSRGGSPGCCCGCPGRCRCDWRPARWRRCCSNCHHG